MGSDEVISIAALAHLVRDIISPEKPIHILGAPNPNSARNHYVPNIHKAKEHLGLGVTIPLAKAIRRAAETHRTPFLLKT